VPCHIYATYIIKKVKDIIFETKKVKNLSSDIFMSYIIKTHSALNKLF